MNWSEVGGLYEGSIRIESQRHRIIHWHRRFQFVSGCIVLKKGGGRKIQSRQTPCRLGRTWGNGNRDLENHSGDLKNSLQTFNWRGGGIWEPPLVRADQGHCKNIHVQKRLMQRQPSEPGMIGRRRMCHVAWALTCFTSADDDSRKFTFIQSLWTIFTVKVIWSRHTRIGGMEVKWIPYSLRQIWMRKWRLELKERRR